MKENVYFETIKCFNGEIFNLKYHKIRIANAINLNINLEEYIYPPSDDLLKCKVIYSDNEILDIQYTKYIKKEISSFIMVYDDTINYEKKSINRYDIDKLKCINNNFDEIIIVKNNYICDTSIANIAIFYNNKWLCTKTPLLVGTTLKRYIDNGFLEEVDISVSMIKNANKIALLNAMVDFDIIQKYTIKDPND